MKNVTLNIAKDLNIDSSASAQNDGGASPQNDNYLFRHPERSEGSSVFRIP